MTLWQSVSIVLGIASLVAGMIVYYAILLQFTLSLLQRAILLFICLVASLTVFFAFILIPVGIENVGWSHIMRPTANEIAGFGAIGVVIAFFALFVVGGTWLLDTIAVIRGKKFKRLEREARASGNFNEADRYKRKYCEVTHRIRMYGRTKEIEALENSI